MILSWDVYIDVETDGVNEVFYLKDMDITKILTLEEKCLLRSSNKIKVSFSPYVIEQEQSVCNILEVLYLESPFNSEMNDILEKYLEIHERASIMREMKMNQIENKKV